MLILCVVFFLHLNVLANNTFEAMFCDSVEFLFIFYDYAGNSIGKNEGKLNFSLRERNWWPAYKQGW